MSEKSIAETIAARHAGRRKIISREEMAAILDDFHAEIGLVNGFVGEESDNPRWWADQVHDIRLISIANPGQLRDGTIRFDQPGSMHPMQQADVTFAAAGVSFGPDEDNGLDYLRQRCNRLLLVR